MAGKTWEGHLIYGVGLSLDGKFPKHILNGVRKPTKEYQLWFAMLNRCYSPNQQDSYVGCTMSDNFKNFQYFAEWCQSQVGFGQKGFHLDKDLLVKGNKIYSEDTCCFVPREINNFLNIKSSKIKNGNLPEGVCFSISRTNGKDYTYIQAGIAVNGKRKSLGNFKTVEEAAEVYLVTKQRLAKELANKFKHEISDKAYNALLNFNIGE